MKDKKTIITILILTTMIMLTMGFVTATDNPIDDNSININDTLNNTIELSTSDNINTLTLSENNIQNEQISPSQINSNTLNSESAQSISPSSSSKINNLKVNSPILYAPLSDSSSIADLGITVSTDTSELTINNNFAFTISLTNNGPNNATNIKITGIIPDDINIVSSTLPTESTNVWIVNQIDANSTLTFNIVATPTSLGIYNAIFSVSSDEVDNIPGNNTAVSLLIVNNTGEPDYADLAVSISLNKENLVLGDVVTLLVTVTNNGPQSATNITVNSTLSSTINILSSTGGYNNTTGQWHINELTSGLSTTLTLTFQLEQIGLHNFTVTAEGNQADPTPLNNYDHITFGIRNETKYADVGISIISDNSNPYVNETFTYIITVVNNGPENATNLIVEDILPTNLELVSSTEGYDNTSGKWTIGSLNSGVSASLILMVKTSIKGTYNNIVTVSSNEIDNYTTNNSANTVVVVNETRPVSMQYADLGLNLTRLRILNDVIYYSLKVINNGPENATNVIVYFNIPDGLNLIQSSLLYDTSIHGWKINRINSGGTSTILFSLKILEEGTYTNLISVTGNQTDIVPTNNTVYDIVKYILPTNYSDIGINVRIFGNTPDDIGQNITYIISVINNGPNTAHNITIKNTLPQGLEFLTASNGYNSTTNTFIISSLSPKNTNSFTLTANITEYGTFTYTASAQGVEQDNYTANNTATATITVLEKTKIVDLNVSISANTTNTTTNESIEYTITITNNGLYNATNITVANILPSELVFTESNLTYNTTTNSWLINKLNTGESIIIRFKVNATLEGNHLTTVSANAEELESNPEDNTASLIVTVKDPIEVEYIIVQNVTGTINTKTNVQVVILDKKGETIKDGNITIKLNGETFNGTVTNGVSIVEITIPEEVGLYNATVTYTGRPGTESTNITVNATPISTQGVTIVVDSATGLVGDNITINATVTDNMGKNMTNGTVTITIGGIDYNGTVTNGTAQINITLPSSTGINIAGVKYTGDEINGTGIAIITVIPIPVNLTAWENITTGNASQTVNILFNVTNTIGENVTGGTVTITINKTSYIADVVNGIANITTILPETPGEYNVTAKYQDNEITTETNITLNVTPAIIDRIIVANITGTINTNTTITIVVLDINGKPIKDGNITLEVNGTLYNTTVTDGVGYLTLTIPEEVGLYNATVTYNGTYGIKNTNITVNATPESTKPIIIINTDTINGTTNQNITVNITVKYSNGENVTNGTLNLTILNKTYTFNVTNGTANVNITLPNTPGVYLGELNFTNDEYNITSIIPIIVKQSDINLTPWENITNGSAGEKVNILFNLTDIYGENVTTGTVTININDSYYIANVINGIANITTILPTETGEYNVTAKYNYENLTKEVNITLNVTPAEIERIIVANITGVIKTNTTITIVVLDKNNKPIKEGNITLELNGTLYNTTVTDGVGYLTLTIPEEVGLYNATVTYNGTYGVKDTNITVNATISTNNLGIQINTNLINGTIGENKTINITVQYTNGENVTNGTLNLTILNKTYTFNVTNGTANINITLPNTPGVYIGELNFTNEDYNITNTIPVIVNQGNITITPWENITKGVMGNTTNILFNITNILGNNVTEGIVILTVNGSSYVTDVNDGLANITVKLPNTPGEYNTTVTYNGYGVTANTTTILNVTPLNVGEIIVGNITGVISTNVTVPVVIFDEEGNLIKEGTVNITINKSSYTATITDGVAWVELTIPESVGIYEANVTYNGSYGTNNTIITVNATPAPSSPGILIGLDTITGHIRQNVTVNVTVKDTNGVNMTNGTVNLTVNGKSYTANVTNGTASVNITLPENSGLSIASVVYTSDDYNGVTNAIVNVTALPVTLTPWENLTNGSAGEIKNIFFNVTDSTGENVTDGTVTVVINSASYIGTVINGTANVTVVLPYTSGEYNATATYLSGDGTISDEANITLNVSQADVIVNIANITSVIDSNISVLVTVVYVNGFVVKSGNITLRVNGSEFNATVVDGIAYLNLTIPHEVGLYNATVTYNGSVSSSVNITVNATPLGSEPVIIVSVEDLPINGTSNSNVSVNITVKYSNGENVTNGTVNITINNITYTVNVTNGTAIVNITLPNTPGVYLAEVNYTNGTDLISTIVPVIISQSGVNLTALENITTGNTSQTVNILFNVTDIYGENVTVGTVSLNVNGTTFIGTVENGIANVTVVLPENPGEYNVTAKYTYEDISSEVNITLNVTSYPASEIIVGNITGIINTNQTIPVTVLDINGNLVKSGNITIYINGSEFNATVINGVAWVNITIPSVVGFYTDANVTYNGIAGVNTTSITVNATAAPSTPGVIIEIPTINGHIRENVTVNLTVKDTNGVNMTNGTVNITINGESYSANVTNGTASVNITLPENSGLSIANVVYTSEDYNGVSNAIVNVTALPVNLTAFENVTNGTAGAIVDVLFNVTDIEGVNVTDGTVTIIVNGSSYVGVVVNGTANVTVVLPYASGEYNVTATYLSTDRTVTDEVNITLNVSQADVVINIANITSVIDSNISVLVTVVDVNGFVVKSGNITLRVNGSVYNATVVDGIAYLNLTIPHEVGLYNATVTYNGSVSSSVNITVNATPLGSEPVIIVSVEDLPINGTTNDNVTINITVKYSNGENVTNGTINITINNVTYVVNVTNGSSSVNVTLPDTPGVYIIEINYTNETNITNIIVPVIVSQSGVNLTALENITTGNTSQAVNILFNVTDIYGENVTVGLVSLNVNGTTFVADVINGIVNVTVVLPENPGEYNVTAKYTYGDISSEVNITLNVTSYPASEIIVGNITGVIGTQVTVPVVVLDVNGNIIKSGNVTIFINGSEFNATVSDGVAWVNVTIPGVVGFYTDANVSYNGIAGVNTTSITVNATAAPSSPGILIGLDTISGHIRENVTVNVTVKDTNGVNMTNGTVNLTVNGESYSANVTNGTASVNITLPENSGLSIANVVYTSEDYNGVSNAIVNVTALPVNLTAFENVTNGTAGSTVDVLFNVTDIEGVNVTDGTVTIIVNGSSYIGSVVNGTANVTVVLPYASGEYNVTATYLSGDGTVTDEVNITLNVSQADVIVNIANITSVIDSNISVLVTVVDVNGFVVKSGNITLRVNGSVYNATVVDGIAYLNLTIPHEVGLYNATVTYNGSVSSSVNITVNATPLGSEPVIIVSVEDLPINGTSNSNVSVNITVKYSNGENVTNGTVNLTINNVTYTVNVTNGTAIVNITLPNTPGVYLAEINYTNETDTILSNIIPVIVSQSDVNLTAFENITNGTAGSTVDILFNVTDIYGENVTDGTVTIVVNGSSYIGVVVNGTANVSVILPYEEGLYNVTAKYLSADGTVTDEVNITLNVTQADIIISSANITGLIGENVTVMVTVTDINGFIVKSGNVTISLNGSKYNAIVINGIAYVNITIPEEVGLYNASIEYNGSLSKDINITVTTVDSSNTDSIIVKLDAINGTIGENITVNITVKYANGENVTNGTINLTIANVTYTVNVTNGTAQVNITLPNTPNVYIGEVNFTDEAVNITLYVPVIVNIGNVNLIPWENLTNGSAGDKVNILFNVTDILGANITSGIVIIKLNDSSYIANVEEGIANVSVILPYESGEYNATAVYIGEGVEVEANITLNVTDSEIAYIIVSNVTGVINSEVLVPVTVIDKNGNLVKGGNITISVDGQNYTSNVIDGVAWVKVNIPGLVGLYDANVTYIGNAGVNSTQIKVNATPVVTTPSGVIWADNINGSVNNNLTVNVNVTDNAGLPLNEGNVTLVIDGVPYNASVENGVAKVNITLPSSPGLYVVNIAYDGDLPASTQVIANVTGIGVILTPWENVTNGTAGSIVSVLFNVTDVLGANVTSGTVTINLNGFNYIANVEDGIANVTVKLPTKSGEYNVTAVYTGNDGVKSEADIILNVTSAGVGRIIVGNVTGIVNTIVTVPVVVLDTNELPIKEGNVTISVEDKNYTANVSDGVAWVELTIPENVGTYPANVSYNGVNTVKSTEITVEALDLTETPGINITTDEITGEPGEEVNITVNVTYTNGTKVDNGTVNITINNKTYGPFNVTNGTAVINITLPDTPGDYPVNITYTDGKRNETVNTTVKVTDPTVLTVTVSANNISGVVNTSKNLTVTVTKSDGSTVTSGTVTININGTIYTKDVTSGTFDVEVKIPTSTGNYTANITYKDNNLEANNTFNVEALSNETPSTNPLAIITTNPISGTIGTTATEIIQIRDEKGNLRTNGTVTVNVGGTIYTETVTNGIVTIPITIPASSTIATVTYTNGEVTNTSTFTITAINPDPEPPTPTYHYADVGITIVVNSTSPYVNDTVTYTITIYNNGPETANNIKVVNTLPEGLEIVNYTGNYNNGWTINTLNNGNTVTYTLTTKTLQTGNIIETMTVSADEIDNNTANNRATITISPQNRPVPPEPTPNSTNTSIDTILILENFTETFGEGKYLTGILMDTNGNVLAGQHIALNLSRASNGQSKVYWATSDYNGRVTLQINLAPGDYLAKGSYGGLTIGNTTYKPTDSDIATIKVYETTSDKIPTITYLSNYTGVYHQSEYLTGKLIDVYGNPLSRQRVGINMTRVRTGENKVYWVTTNSTGDFKLLIQLRNDDYYSTAIFEGTTRYMESRSAVAILNITL